MATSSNNWATESITAVSTVTSIWDASVLQEANLIIQNLDSANGVQISFTDATAAITYLVLAAGGTLTLGTYRGPIYAKSVTGTVNVYVGGLAH